MKLRTSFFNSGVLRKDLTRFAPLWVLYSVLVALFVILQWEIYTTPARFASNAEGILAAMAVVNFFYAPLITILLFGDLFHTRLCYGLHALPLRREGWFLTHVCAGLLMGLVPNTAASLFCAALLQEYAYTALLWLAVMVLEFLFFFGAAVFSVHCAGNWLGAVAIYGIINFAAVFLGWFWILFYQPLLFGTPYYFEDIIGLSPVVGLTGATFLDLRYGERTEATYVETVLWEQWRFAGIAAGVGVVLLVLALLLYRKRKLEKAGSLLAFSGVEPVFLVMFTLCGGAVLFTLGQSIDLGYFFLLVGFAICFFGGRMLIERRTRVFRVKNLLAFGIFVAIFFTSIGFTALDPLGVEEYVPEVEKVESVEIWSDYRYPKLQLTDKKNIELITQVHGDCIQECHTPDYGQQFHIRYSLKNGTTVQRSYYLVEDSSNQAAIGKLFSQINLVFGTNSPQQILSGLRRCTVNLAGVDEPLVSITSKEAHRYITDSNAIIRYVAEEPSNDPVLTGLLDAMIQDCLEGNMDQDVNIIRPEFAYVEFDADIVSREVFMIYEDCTHTVAYLKQLYEQSKEPVTAPTTE